MVATYREALRRVDRAKRAASNGRWRRTGLGNALGLLGERERDPAQLEEALATYHGGAAPRPAATARPLDWAMIKNNLGVALRNAWGCAKAAPTCCSRRSRPIAKS